MYVLYNTETDFLSQMPAGFDLSRLHSNTFLIWKHSNFCFFASEAVFRPFRHCDWTLVGGAWPRAVWGEDHEEVGS